MIKSGLVLIDFTAQLILIPRLWIENLDHGISQFGDLDRLQRLNLHRWLGLDAPQKIWRVDFYLIGIVELAITEEPKIDDDGQKFSKPLRFGINEVQQAQGDVAASNFLEEISGSHHQVVHGHRILLG